MWALWAGSDRFLRHQSISFIESKQTMVVERRNWTMKLVLAGTLRISESDKSPKTCGEFARFMNENAQVFRNYFGTKLSSGSLNVDVSKPLCLHKSLDAGQPKPAFVIPSTEFKNQPNYIGDGQAWRILLKCSKIPDPVQCWIFRRIGSRDDSRFHDPC